MFSALRLPKASQAALPFASKPKLLAGKTQAQKLKAKARAKKPVARLRHAIVSSSSEQRKVNAMMHRLRTIRNEKTAKRKAKHMERLQDMLKRKARDEAKRTASQKLQKRRLESVFFQRPFSIGRRCWLSIKRPTKSRDPRVSPSSQALFSKVGSAERRNWYLTESSRVLS